MTDTATYLYHAFKPSANSTALAYIVTPYPASAFYRYFFAPGNAGHFRAAPLQKNKTITYTVYVPESRKRLGPGTTALDVKLSSWAITWRGIEMNVYLTDVRSCRSLESSSM